MHVKSSRFQFLVLFFTLAMAAGGLFIPVPDPGSRIQLSLFTSSDCEKLVADLSRDFQGGTDKNVQIEADTTDRLAGRIRRGRIPDILVAAGEEEIHRLAEQGYVDPETSVPLLESPLVLVLPAGKVCSRPPLRHLLHPSVRSIAVCAQDTEVGRTTVEALKAMGLWYQVLHRVRPCPSAHVALGRVRRGEADAAVVFGPDVLGKKNIQAIQSAFPWGSYTPVRYTAVLLKKAPHPRAGRGFLSLLASPEARKRIQAFEAGKRLPVPPDRGSRVWTPLLLSLRATCLALMVVFPLALATAGYLANRTSMLSRYLDALVNLPLVIPPVAVGCILMLLFSREGPVARITGLPLAFTWQAGALAAGIMSFPLAVRPIRNALEAVDPRYLMAARTLGGTRFSCFLLISLPLAGRGLAAGGVLAFARALGEFGATLVVAGNIPGLTRFLPQALFVEFESGNTSLALYLLLALVMVSFLATLAYEYLEIRRPRP